MKEFLNQTYFNNTITDYLWCVGSFLVYLIVIFIVKKILKKRVEKWIAKREEDQDNKLLLVVNKYLPLFLYLGAFYFSIKILTLNSYINKAVDIVILILVTYLVAVIASALMDFFLNQYSEKVNTDSNRQFAIHWVSKIAKGIIWGIAIILFLQNLGIEIGALVAGLGIGGIAIAFAAQAILEDVFSYFTIFFDRPFEIGDFINTGEYLGTVEYIGLRTTRLRSISGEQLIFPNKDLTNSRVKNFKAMEQRRVVFKFGVTYDTSLTNLKAIPSIIQGIVEAIPDTKFDRTHFLSYGDSSLVFEAVYYVSTGDYMRYMDIQQEINLNIKEIFDEKGIEFAFPTRTVLLQNNANVN